MLPSTSSSHRKNPIGINDYYDPYKQSKNNCCSPRKRSLNKSPQPSSIDEQSSERYPYHYQNNKRAERIKTQPQREWPSCMSRSMEKRIKEIIAERNKRINSVNESQRNRDEEDEKRRKEEQQRLFQKERVRQEVDSKGRKNKQVAAYVELGDYKVKPSQQRINPQSSNQPLTSTRNPRRQSPNTQKPPQPKRQSPYRLQNPNPIEITNFKKNQPVSPSSQKQIKVIKKIPMSKQQVGIKTTVEAPSSIATSILNNFESNPDRLLGNMSQSKLDKVFLKF